MKVEAEIRGRSCRQGASKAYQQPPELGERPGMDFPLELREGSNPAHIWIHGLPVSRTMMKQTSGFYFFLFLF